MRRYIRYSTFQKTMRDGTLEDYRRTINGTRDVLRWCNEEESTAPSIATHPDKSPKTLLSV